MNRSNRMRTLAAFLAAAGSLLTSPVNLNGQETGALRTLVRSDSSLTMPSLSPDGKWLLAVRDISNTDSRLLIGSALNGQLRELPLDRGQHFMPMLTPAGDRLVFVSSSPRRSPTDNSLYLVSAPFDSKSGSVAGSVRQISLEGVRVGPRLRPSISPNGQWVAFVTCCGEADELRIVPISGGNSRVIVRGGRAALQRPGLFVWSADSRSLSYEMRDGGVAVVRLTSVDGGLTKVVARLAGATAAISPDRRLFVVSTDGPRPRLRILSADGSELASLSTPKRILFLSFSADGRRLIGANNDGGNTLKIVSENGGSVRTIGANNGRDWPIGWDENAISVSSDLGPQALLRGITANGKIVRTTLHSEGRGTSLWHGQLLYEEPIAGATNRIRLIVRHPTTGANRELIRDALGGCCDPVGPGGNYWQVNGDERLVRTMRGKQVEIRGIRFDGRTRIVGVLPAGLPLGTFSAVHGEKMAYTDVVGDSSRLRVIPGRGQVPRTLMSTGVQPGIGEFAWSNNGRMLAMYTNGSPQRIRIFRFDSLGAVVGEPQVIEPPFEYFYEMFWRPDDAGLSMIAQPKGAKFSDIAVLSLADPGNPTLLTKSDASNKWGHSPSPDGKWIAYPSEWVGGGAIVEIDVAKLLKGDGKRR